jgi:hypothetical protein
VDRGDEVLEAVSIEIHEPIDQVASELDRRTLLRRRHPSVEELTGERA